MSTHRARHATGDRTRSRSSRRGGGDGGNVLSAAGAGPARGSAHRPRARTAWPARAAAAWTTACLLALALAAVVAVPTQARGAVLISSLDHGGTYFHEIEAAKIAFGIRTGRNRLGYVLKSVDIAYQDADADHFSAQLCGLVITEHLPGVDFGDPSDNRVRRYEPTTTCQPLTAPGVTAFAAGTCRSGVLPRPAMPS